MNLTVAVLAIALTLVPAARAADVHPAVGDTLRAYVRGGRVEGTFVAADGVALTLRVKRTDSVIPLDAMTRLDVKPRTSRGRHAAWGALMGVRLGGIVAVGSSGGTCDGGTCGSADTALAVGMLGGIGSDLGAVIGAALPTTHWRRIDTKGLRVSVSPVARGAALRVSVSF